MTLQSQSARWGVLLIQLGTPDAPTTSACRRYLREFLLDPLVIDLPSPLRWLLVEGIIVPFRAPKSAKAYQQIWTEKGSPLRFHSEKLREKIQKDLGDAIPVELGMRYGKPSLPNALWNLQKMGVSHLLVCPLYPQYAGASTGSSLSRVFELLRQQWAVPALKVVPPFFDEPFFIDALVQSAKETEEFHRSNLFLFSYHGLPERQIRRTDVTGTCAKSSNYNCCMTPGPHWNFCYRAQCLRTTEALKRSLNLSDDVTFIGFQSRLGRTPWIRPFTDEILIELAAKFPGKNLAVFTPSFTADCLETLEEIEIRGRESFQRAGGGSLSLIPAPNSSDRWASGLSAHLRRSMSEN